MNKKQTAEAARKRKNEKAKEYYQEHKIEIRIKRKKNYQKTREAEKQYSREYYAKHKAKRKKQVK